MAGGRGESYQEVTATRQAEEGELRQTNTAGVDIWWAAALEDDTVGEGRETVATVATVAVTMAAAATDAVTAAKLKSRRGKVRVSSPQVRRRRRRRGGAAVTAAADSTAGSVAVARAEGTTEAVT